ncbi:MAG: hypothetical protein GX256_05420 [Fretibacterium sp.]|nr:hypothetical protein [Fretibacterium sp.]
MSSLRQGVLRAVRLLPEAVKIGIEPETALPSEKKEEQHSNVPLASSGAAPSKEVTADTALLEEQKQRIKGLQAELAAALEQRQALEEQGAHLQTELEAARAEVKQKESAFAAQIEGARAQARQEGHAQGEQEGRERGYSAGLEQARTEVKAEYLERFGAVTSLLENFSVRLETDFADLVALNQPRMLRLWLDILKRMLRREVELAPDSVLKVLKDVLVRLGDKNNVILYVAPEDLELLEGRLDKEFEDLLRGVRHLELKTDSSVDRGSCVVETRLGIYDARWRTQMGQIEGAVEKLFQELGKGGKMSRSRGRSTEVDPLSSIAPDSSLLSEPVRGTENSAEAVSSPMPPAVPAEAEPQPEEPAETEADA